MQQTWDLEDLQRMCYHAVGKPVIVQCRSTPRTGCKKKHRRSWQLHSAALHLRRSHHHPTATEQPVVLYHVFASYLCCTCSATHMKFICSQRRGTSHLQLCGSASSGKGLVRSMNDRRTLGWRRMHAKTVHTRCTPTTMTISI